jgi:hypothetical protein
MKTTKLVLIVSLAINALLGVFIWRDQMPRPPLVNSPPEERWPPDWYETALPLPAGRNADEWMSPIVHPLLPLKKWSPKEIEFTDPAKANQYNDAGERFQQNYQMPPRIRIPAPDDLEVMPPNMDRGLYITPKAAGI